DLWRFDMMLATLALAVLSLPVFAQDAETDRLKKEMEKLKADNEVLLRQLQVTQAQLRETNEKFEKAKAPNATYKSFVIPAPAAPAVVVRKPRPALDGKVTAVAPEIGLVVLSIGSDSGVREGDEFTVTRSGDLVAKVTVARVDRAWSAAKVIFKKSDPR